jgi:hypothetical protein
MDAPDTSMEERGDDGPHPGTAVGVIERCPKRETDQLAALAKP